MKFVRMFLLTMVISFSAFAQNNNCNPNPTPDRGHEDRGRDDRGRDDRGRDDRRRDDRGDHGGRRGDDRVSSQCSLSPIMCGSSDGSRGNIPACSIKCYRNESAVCTPGDFSFSGCQVENYNSCECI